MIRAALAIATCAGLAAAAHADPPAVKRGTCDLSLFPKAYLDRDANADALAASLGGWLADPTKDVPPFELQHGIVWVESAEDRGDDPPYPKSAAPEAERVCGTHAAWMRTALRELLARRDDLVCDGNVCCYGGMEYAPDGFVVFRRVKPGDQVEWVIDAWVQVYDRALGAEVVTANRRWVTSSLKKLATGKCAGERAGED
jgi:hypothetical protein